MSASYIIALSISRSFLLVTAVTISTTISMEPDLMQRPSFTCRKHVFTSHACFSHRFVGQRLRSLRPFQEWHGLYMPATAAKSPNSIRIFTKNHGIVSLVFIKSTAYSLCTDPHIDARFSTTWHRVRHCHHAHLLYFHIVRRNFKLDKCYPSTRQATETRSVLQNLSQESPPTANKV